MSQDIQAWYGDAMINVTIRADVESQCVFVDTTDGFYICTEDDADLLADFIKVELRKMKTNDWCMENL